MPVYAYRGRNRTGSEVRGEREADTKQSLVATLRREQINPLVVKEKGKEFTLPKLGGKVKTKELAIFTRQFSVMIDAGLPLVQCLEALASQQENKVFQDVLQSVRTEVEGGSTLAFAMRQHPKVFDELYTNMIAAGEAGGILDTILQRLSQYIEKNVKLKRAVKSAMVYPIVVLTIAVGVIVLILWKVVPIFSQLFASMDVSLPLPTRIVIGFSNFVGRYIIFFIPIVIAAWYAFKKYYATEDGRRVVDLLLLKIPVMGNVLKKIAVARFSRTLSTLISSGVPILDGLEITAKTSGNAVVEEAIMKTRTSIEGGKTIVEPLRETGIFPSMVTQMVGVGEQTGALDAMLTKIAEFFEDEVDAAVADLLTAIEPLMILILGVIVGGIVVSMYLPLFSLISKLSM
ncbi:MAG TPA: type II secretion system F family protein [Terriglobia bacterium]|nr:type II secretion system F family protein [Terriglobia bacterium]